MLHVHWCWWKTKHQQQTDDEKCSVNVSHRLHVFWCRLWADTVHCVCAREHSLFFQSNLSRRSEKSDIPHSLVIFLKLINEPDYNRVSHLFFSLSFGFDSIPIFFRRYIVALSFQQFTKWFESLVFFHSQFRLFKTPLFSHKYVLCMLFRVFCFAVFFVALFIHLKHLNQYMYFPIACTFHILHKQMLAREKSDYFRNGLIYACLRHYSLCCTMYELHCLKRSSFWSVKWNEIWKKRDT